MNNHETKIRKKGMPLGNLTSQFFANVYLNEMDYFIKHRLKIKYYIRYVDDFIILENNKFILEEHKKIINEFAMNHLKIELHPNKTKIHDLENVVPFLGLRIFPHHKLIAKRNIRKFKNKLSLLMHRYENEEIDYDKIYDTVEGWTAYTKISNSYNIRKSSLQKFNEKFTNELSIKEYNRHLKKLNKIDDFSEK